MFRPVPAAPCGRPAARGSAKLCVGASTARAPRYCRGRVLALAQNGRYLARDIARCRSRGIGTARACRLIARVDNQLIYPDAAVAQYRDSDIGLCLAPEDRKSTRL